MKTRGYASGPESPIEPTDDSSAQKERERAQRDARGRLLPGHSHAWKPGQSGNPTGNYPRSEKAVTDAARSLAMKGLENLAEIMADKRAQAVARVRAVEIILERGYGKAPQKVIVDTEVAGLSNTALAAYMRARLEEMTRTIEHVPADGNGDDEG